MFHRASPFRSDAATFASVVIANIAGFALYLALPHFLEPNEFSRFSITMTMTALLVALLFEWMRNGIIRFTGLPDPIEAARYEKTLYFLYRVSVATALIIAALIAPLQNGFAVIVAVALVCAVGQALFDGMQASARAHFRMSRFSAAWGLRSVLSLGATVSVAILSDSGLAATLAFGVSNLFCYLLFRQRDESGIGSFRPASADMATLLKYGGFIAASTAMNSLFAVSIRYIPNLRLSLADLAGLMLAFDISSRIVGIAGLTINLLGLQNAIRSIDEAGAEAGARNLSAQLSALLFAMTPTVVAAASVLPMIASMVFRPSYLLSFNACLIPALICSALQVVRVFAIDPVFILKKRSTLSVIAPTISVFILLFGASLTIGLGLSDSRTMSLVACCSAAVALLVAIMLSRQILTFPVIWPDVIYIFLSCSLLCIWLDAINISNNIFGLVIGLVIFGLTYCIGAYYLNIFHLRTRLRNSL